MTLHLAQHLLQAVNPMTWWDLLFRASATPIIRLDLSWTTFQFRSSTFRRIVASPEVTSFMLLGLVWSLYQYIVFVHRLLNDDTFRSDCYHDHQLATLSDMVSKEASSEVPLRLKREHESKEMFSTPQTDGQDPVARRSPAPNDSISPHVHGQPLSNKHPDHSASMTQNDRYEEPESLLRTHATYPGSPCVCICSCAEEDMIVELEDDVRKPPCLVCQPTPPHSPPQQSGKLPHPALSIPRSTIPPSKSASEPHTPACSVRPREPQPRVGKDDSALGLIKPEKGQAQHPWTGSEKLQRQTVSSEPEKLPQAHSKTHAEEIEEAQHHFRDELLEADTTVMDVL